MKFKYQRILWEIESLLGKYSYNIQQKKISQWKVPQRDAFWITENTGNNSFSYKKGKKLFVPALIHGNEHDIQTGENIVFEDEGKKSFGLESYIFGHSKKTQTPIFICDNHNYVLEAWKTLYTEKGKPLFLVHIDQHRDDAKFEGNLDEYMEETKICDYIDSAIQQKWIMKEYLSFIDSQGLVKKKKVNSCILNIDLDFFCPELNTIDLEEKISLIFYYLSSAELITLATSPLFINQEFAQEIAKLFWKYL